MRDISLGILHAFQRDCRAIAARPIGIRVMGVLVVGMLVAPVAVAAPMSDAQVRQAIIQESLAKYPGNCPCPYNLDRAGHRCGRRSAYSRPGGYAPICYASQVTPEMIRRYRATHPR